MERLQQVIAQLRKNCPWMAALTTDSLVDYLLEEAYELVEALETGTAEQVRGELGDVLLQVVLHARLSEETGGFTLAEVAHGLTAKMVRRNPHVFFPDGTLRGAPSASLAQIESTWQQVKQAEHGSAAPRSPYAGIPAALPALSRAGKTLDRAARHGRTLPPPPAALATGPTAPRTQEDFGELLLGLVGLARSSGWDAEQALRAAVRRFQDSET
jgi:uncharacterized protein YabN with tetrapyrrole methylase and pyrophosphatase domain